MVLRCTIWCGIGISVIATVLLGLEISFNVYAISLKKTFNLTQTQVELVSSSGLVGMGFSLTESFITGRFGYKVGYAFIFISTSLSAIMMWLATVYADVYTNWFGILVLITFLMSFSQNAGSTRLAAITLNNVPKQHTGKVVGVYMACLSLAQLVYSSVFLYVFKESMQKFFFATTVSFVLTVGLCILLHKPVAEASQFYNSIEPISTNDPTDETQITQDGNRVCDLIGSRDFHMIFWPCVIHYSIMFAFMNNVSSISYSLGVDVPLYLVDTLAITITIGRTASGLAFDRLHTYRCGFGILLSGSLSTVLALCISTIWLNQTTIYAISILFGIGSSSGLTIPNALLSVRFGQSHYPFILGSYYCMVAAFCSLFQAIVGFVYDMDTDIDGFCYGAHCFQISFEILLAVSVLCSILQVVAMCRKI